MDHTEKCDSGEELVSGDEGRERDDRTDKYDSSEGAVTALSC